MVTYRVHRPQVLFFVVVYVACWETAENWHWISWIYSIQFNAIEFDSMLKWNTIEIIAEFQLLFLISDLFIAGGETTITTLRWVYLAILSVKLRATIWWCFDVVAVDICLSAGHLVSGDIHRIAGQDQRGNYQQHRLWRNPFVSRPWLSLRSYVTKCYNEGYARFIQVRPTFALAVFRSLSSRAAALRWRSARNVEEYERRLQRRGEWRSWLISAHLYGQDKLANGWYFVCFLFV